MYSNFSLLENWEYKEYFNCKKPSKIILLFHGVGSDFLDLENLGLILLNTFSYKDSVTDASLNKYINYPTLELKKFKNISYLQNAFKDNVMIISLNGPDKYDNGFFGRQWFSLQDRTQSVIQAQVHQGYLKLKEFLSSLMNKYELTSKDIGVIGFSQGGMLASYAAIMENLGCCIAFSSCAIGLEKVTDTPACFIHGKEDDIVELELLEKSLSLFSPCFKNGIDKFLIDNLKHAIDLTGIQYAIKFMIDKNFIQIEK